LLGQKWLFTRVGGTHTKTLLQSDGLCWRTGNRNMKNRSRKAFTLLELIVAVVILAIISAIALPSFLSLIGAQGSSSAKSAVMAASREAYSISQGSGVGVSTANIYSAYTDASMSATSIPSTMTAGGGGVVKYAVTINGTTYNNCVTYSGAAGILPVFSGAC